MLKPHLRRLSEEIQSKLSKAPNMNALSSIKWENMDWDDAVVQML